MSFKPRSIPVHRGAHQEISPVNMSQPDMLDRAENVIPIKKGSLRGRPGIALLSSTTPDGPYAGAEAYQGRLVNLAQGGLMEVTAAGTARKAGKFWSMQRFAAPNAGYRTLNATNPGPVVGVNVTRGPAAPAGKYFVASPVTRNGASGFPLLGAHAGDGYSGLTSTALTNFDATAQLGAVMASNAKDALYYVKADGSTWMYVVDSTGASNEFAVQAAGAVSTSATQPVWIVAGAASNEFFLIDTSTTAGRINVTRITDAGTITATLALTGLGTISYGAAMAHNGLPTAAGGRLCIGYYDTAAPAYKTVVVTCTTTASFTNAGIGVTHQTGPGAGATVAPTTAVGKVTIASTPYACVVYQNSTWDTVVEVRDFTSNAAAIFVYEFWNTQSTPAWQPWFAPCNLAWTDGTSGAPSQVVLGLFRTVNTFPVQAQAIVVAVSAGRPAQVLSATAPNSVWASVPQNALFMSGGIGQWQLRQTVWEGQFFNTTQSKAFALVPADYYSVAARGVEVSGSMVFSGQTPWIWDGADPQPLGFVERYPDWLAGTGFSGAGGSFTAGASYSFQAIWELTNGRGQVVRSGQSTVFTASPAAGNSFTAVLSIPQLIGRPLSANQGCRVKVYQTIATPPAGAPLYLAGGFTVTGLASGIPGAGKVTITLTAQTDTSQEQLYTGAVTFDDLPPAGGGRGVAFAMDRLWTADHKNVYASKQLRTDVQVAFNESGGLRVPVPQSIGEVMGIGSLGDRLLVIGQRGVGVVYGPGVDDNGNGPGWTVEETARSVGMSRVTGSGPRCVVSLPGARAAFVGGDYGVWLVDHNGMPSPMTRPVQDNLVTSPPLELAYLDAGGGNGAPEYSEALVVSTANGDQLFFADHGEWVTWFPAAGAPRGYASVGGVMLFVAGTTGSVYQYSDWNTCLDLGITQVSAFIMTSQTSIAGDDGGATPTLAWGRLRSVNPTMRIFTGAPTLTMQVYGDDGNTLLAKSFSPVAGGGNWPGPINSSEFRCTQQRCSTFQILLQVQPATVELSAFDIWYDVTGDRAPARNRA